MSSYFTIVHIVVLAIMFILMVLFFVLSLRGDRKLFLPLLITNVLVVSSTSVFLMLVIDKYTKKGRLDNVTTQRVLRNESIVLAGTITNVGRFKLSGCTLNVKLINQALSKDNLGGETLFKPSGASIFGWLFDDKGEDKPNTVEYKFKLAKNLEPKKSIPFSVSMPYPPYFSKGSNVTKLSCY